MGRPPAVGKFATGKSKLTKSEPHIIQDTLTHSRAKHAARNIISFAPNVLI